MATLLLSAAGAALGGSFGGSFIGLGTAALGKALGATVGSIIDQRLMGVGSEPVESGRVERFRVMGSSEGAAIPRVWGRVRLAGQIIWSSRFLEHVNSNEVGGKGGGGATVREYSYTVSLAIALCEGPVVRVGRIWADGQPLEQKGLNWRLHEGTEEQIPDPLIAAIEGAEEAPAYRGTAYIVFDNLDLTPFGNRIPQFNFEVFRRPDVQSKSVPAHPAESIRGVALVPGTGEYALATEPISFKRGKGSNTVVNVHNDQGVPDLVASLAQMKAELPVVTTASLVVTWFGDDMRAGKCTLRPKVEQSTEDGDKIAWRVSNLSRVTAERVSLLDGRPIFGGTPDDTTVVQAIRHMRNIGVEVMFYPFILMDILAGNGLADPWSDATSQPVIPWRGRITLDTAPGRAGSQDGTTAAESEIGLFVGSARPSDFAVEEGRVVYKGPAEWSYRRFILHYAHLCALAGGVKAFCIGSELRSLTQVRDGRTSYPFVRALCALAADVRAILGPDCKIGYAADWSEYFGHHPADGSNDVIFHLDPLWAHPDIDFVGIDNYMPLSDWRNGSSHADAHAESIFNLEYLRSNVAGGEGFDWFYSSDAAREAQSRTPIVDGGYGEHWVFRYKDIRSWWSQTHVNRVGGIRGDQATDWVPQSKPIWFTELGCPAVDKGTNQPNVFHDPKSSESFLPYFSNGGQDTFIQTRYLQATYAHWGDPLNNPVSTVYAAPMVDLASAYVWAWDTRPWPDFPARLETWLDGTNYALGHWLNGRTSLAPLAQVVAEISEQSDMSGIDVSGLHGQLTGYSLDAISSGRQAIQPLMVSYGFDGFSFDGNVVFRNRNGRAVRRIFGDGCVVTGNEAVVARSRSPWAELPSSVTFGYVDADRDYAASAVSAALPDFASSNSSQSSQPVVLSANEAQSIAERWLSESLAARDTVEFALPLSDIDVTAGDVITLAVNGSESPFRVDRVEEQGLRRISAVRVDAGVYGNPVPPSVVSSRRSIPAVGATYAEFLDLPLLKGDEVPYAPHVAVSQKPWMGAVAIYSASEDHGYTLNTEVTKPAVVGDIMSGLVAGQAGLWLNASLRVKIASGTLQSRSELDVLNGANVAAIRAPGSSDWEIIQYRSAVLVSPLEYELSGILRGQAGTDSFASGPIAPGWDFVLLDQSVKQIELASAARDLERHYRYGPSRLPYNDPAFTHVAMAFEGVGLRPYAPVHLHAERNASGHVVLTWIRRSRIDGDSWQGTDIPLGEDRELYHVRILKGDTLVREESVSSPTLRYSQESWIADGSPQPLAFEVAQVSDRFGPGPYRRIVL